MRKRNAGKVLAMLIVACVAGTACGDKERSVPVDDKGQPVSVSISIDAPFKLQPEPVEYKNAEGGAWFKHTLTVENTTGRPIAISGYVSPQFIGEHKLLVFDSQCAVGPPAPNSELPIVTCATSAPLPAEVEPHTAAKLGTVSVYKGLNGMSTLTPGEYKADASIHWKFADESETHTDMAKFTYRVK
jgi:hypothetical protein